MTRARTLHIAHGNESIMVKQRHGANDSIPESDLSENDPAPEIARILGRAVVRFRGGRGRLGAETRTVRSLPQICPESPGIGLELPVSQGANGPGG